MPNEKAMSATDDAEREQRALAHFAEPRGGKDRAAGLTYSRYVRNVLMNCGAKFTAKKAISSEEILCQTKKRVRSILKVCEELAY